MAALDLITAQYEAATAPWVVGFSGGKDSSVLLRLLFTSMTRLRTRDHPVTVVYCDTGVEIPVVTKFARRTLNRLRVEARERRIPLRVRIATPVLTDSYFVRVIGRGYPPPTNKFRWCTDRLRIAPVQRVIREVATKGSVVLLGVRMNESNSRDRTLRRLASDQPNFLKQEGGSKSLVFAPILDFSTEDVWETLHALPLPAALDARRLFQLYRDSAGECPLIRDPKGQPCGRGRFGCWTCTVIRKDHGMTSLIETGHDDMLPLLQFRNWLQEIRDDPTYRCSRRRNGAPGPGPITLRGRRLILRRLRVAENRSGLKLISPAETALIHTLWSEDRRSSSYLETEQPV